MSGPEHPLGRRRSPGRARAAGHEIGDADFDEIRDVPRCGIHHRVHEAITAAAENF
jgi:isoquinoline 1-oxidoreductase subunit alpha